MLDSSPVALPMPPTRKQLKRSASTASLASMPTPPRTHKKHTRGRSRGECESDSDEADAALLGLSSDEEDNNAAARDGRHVNKKRRVGQADDEDVFWGGGAIVDATSAGGATSSSKKQPLLYRRLAGATTAAPAPVSPPPSHRKPAAALAPVTPPAQTFVDSPPSTPRKGGVTTRGRLAGAVRDSPGNPFLATPEGEVVEESATPSPMSGSASASPRTPGAADDGERPMMAYVFRGQRRLYPNPYYNKDKKRAVSPGAETRLAVEDPDYEAPVLCPPTLLFKEAHKKAGKARAAKKVPPPRLAKRVRSPSLSGDELPPALVSKEPDVRKRTRVLASTKAKNTRTLEEEMQSAGEPF